MLKYQESCLQGLGDLNWEASGCGWMAGSLSADEKENGALCAIPVVLAIPESLVEHLSLVKVSVVDVLSEDTLCEVCSWVSSSKKRFVGLSVNHSVGNTCNKQSSK